MKFREKNETDNIDKTDRANFESVKVSKCHGKNLKERQSDTATRRKLKGDEA